MKKIGLFIICLIALVALSNSDNSYSASNKIGTAVASQTVSDTDSDSGAKAASLPKLIDFGSKKCMACKLMEPVLDSCMQNHGDKFITEFIDVWMPQNQIFARSHNIQSIPTQVFFDKDGKEVFRHVGFISEDDILNKFKEFGLLPAAATNASTSEKIVVPTNESPATPTTDTGE